MTATTMTPDIIDGAQLRTGYILSLIDPNRTDPASPIRPVNLRDSVRACLQLHHYLAECCAFAWKAAFESHMIDYNETGMVCVLGLETALKTCRIVERVLDAATQSGELTELNGHFEEVAAKFRLAIPELERTTEDFRKRWPWFIESRLRDSMEMAVRGERGKNTGDAFRVVRNRIQGLGS